MRTHKEIFTEIYDKNVWGGSGGGSSPENTVEYRKLLQKFLKEKNIKSVLDWGCGDWAFSRLIDWTGIQYTGVDVVDSVVNKNVMQYAKNNIMFFNDEIWPGGEYYDLVIVKDVLQHWSNPQIDSFLNEMMEWGRFKYMLITNTLGTSENEIVAGDCRGLSANIYPMNQYNIEILAVIKTTIISEVSLITNI